VLETRAFAGLLGYEGKGVPLRRMERCGGAPGVPTLVERGA
jgi:hypothetical protein